MNSEMTNILKSSSNLISTTRSSIYKDCMLFIQHMQCTLCFLAMQLLVFLLFLVLDLSVMTESGNKERSADNDLLVKARHIFIDYHVSNALQGS